MPAEGGPHTAAADASARPTLSWRVRIAIALGGTLLKVLGWTWRLQIIGRDALAARPKGTNPVVFTLWHGQMLACLYGHKIKTGVLISEHRDGEIISQIVAMFGAFGIRGSSSRGGTRALLEAVRVARQGTDIAFTPDGPRGPRYSYAPGPLILAHRAGIPIVTITAHADRMWQLRSWDHFEIPKPFAKVTVLYGAPQLLADADVREAAERVEEFSADMQEKVRAVAALSAARS
ncbi:MAG TPA: lysophospholipid acyltransferase family protein [Gemmatimonas sp.]|uniref:lysophospholipid acyltransferase family protein n=1 Tax=Gemmatimonas sp. TaxID=1962908 RepID=UPI002ED7ECB3